MPIHGWVECIHRNYWNLSINDIYLSHILGAQTKENGFMIDLVRYTMGDKSVSDNHLWSSVSI